jgi:hypothetical protein
MNLTYRQLILLTTAITVFYDEVAKTSTPEMQHEILELSDVIQEYAERKQRADERREKKNETL